MRHFAALLAVLLLAAACGGQVGSSPSATSPAASPSEPAAASPSAIAASPSAAASPSGSAAPAGSGDTVEVTGVEYAFEGVPSTTPAGTSFAFRNGGQEVHEMVVVMKNAGVTESFEELLQLPEEEAFSKVTPVGATVATPGSEAPNTVTVSQPGEYLMVCFVPVGTTSASIDPSNPPQGEPHYARGMLAEFTVE